eukprot:Skav214179  [mRNA]  locus=scaffold945:488771:497048:- [translate_table: standard]
MGGYRTSLLLLATVGQCARLDSSGAGLGARGRQLMQTKTSPLPQAQSFLHELMALTDNVTDEHLALEPLQWRVLRQFPPLVTTPSSPEARKCSKVGRQFPELVSRDESTLEDFYKYACGPAADFFDPTIALTGAAASLERGCVNLPLARQPWPDMMRVSNRTHGEDVFRPPVIGVLPRGR